MAYRKRHRGTTTERGYHSRHQRLAAALLAMWQPGDPCTRCGRGMWQRWMVNRAGKRVSAIHLAHTPDRTGYEGLQHAYCNTSEGAQRGNRMRTATVASAMANGWPSARRW